MASERDGNSRQVPRDSGMRARVTKRIKIRQGPRSAGQARQVV